MEERKCHSKICIVTAKSVFAQQNLYTFMEESGHGGQGTFCPWTLSDWAQEMSKQNLRLVIGEQQIKNALYFQALTTGLLDL